MSGYEPKAVCCPGGRESICLPLTFKTKIFAI